MPNNNIPDKHVEQTPLEPPIKPQLRRSNKKNRPSQRYSPYEYTMIID